MLTPSQVDVLGHVLLINRLLPLIRQTAQTDPSSPPRIISLSSSLHRTAASSVQFNSLEEINDSSLSAVQLYARAKLALVLYTKFGLIEKEFKPHGDNIIALISDPGTVATEQQEQLKETYGQTAGAAMKQAVHAIAVEPNRGSLSTLWAATSPAVVEKKLQGVYVTDPYEWGGESTQANDRQLGEQLWELSRSIIKMKAGEDAWLD